MEVIAGKADAIIIDSMSAQRIVDNNPGKLQRLLGGRPLAVYPDTFSVKKGEDRLLRTLNAGLEAAINIGAVDEIVRRYDPHGNLLPVPAPYSPSTSRME